MSKKKVVRNPKRTPKQLQKIADRILVYISKHPLCNVEEIQAKLKLTNADTALPIRKLVALKKLKRKGKARGVRYTAR